jgi:hypothetical protein
VVAAFTNPITWSHALTDSKLQVSIRIFKGMELRQAKDQGVATMIERDGVITGYAAGIGIFGHAVAKSNEDLKAVIANASAILGPGCTCSEPRSN